MKKRKGLRKIVNGNKYYWSDLESLRRNQKKRVETNREARRRGIYGKRKKMGKDLSHGSDGSLVLEDVHANRSRNGKDGKPTVRKVSRHRRKKAAARKRNG